MPKESVIEVLTGPHDQDGVEFELFTRHLIAMRVKGQAERVKTTLLTRDQAARLRDALDELIKSLDESAADEPPGNGPVLRAA